MKILKSFINRNKYIKLYFTNKQFKAEVGLYFGTAFNLFYAVFYLSANVVYGAIGSGITGIYYAVLFIIRYFLIRNSKNVKEIKKLYVRNHYEWVIYKNCGIFLLILNLAIGGMLWYRIFTVRKYKYPLIFFIVSSCYTLYRFAVTVYKISKKYTHSTIILSAAKRIDFCIVAMSVFEVQINLLSVLNVQKITTMIINSLSTFVVFASVIFIAIKMITKAKSALICTSLRCYGNKQLVVPIFYAINLQFLCAIFVCLCNILVKIKRL